MHAKRRRVSPARALFYAVFSALAAASAGCALIADLGGSGERSEPGSKTPDSARVTPQLEGGSSPTPSCSAGLASDPDHCGWCGHACGGAACNGGLCAPSAIVSADDVRHLVVDEDRVVFATSSEVRTCP